MVALEFERSGVPALAISLDDLAERQWADLRNLTPGTCFEDRAMRLGLDEAYAVQAAVARLRVKAGDAVAGYKVGCTGPGIHVQFGMHGPIRACLFESELRKSGAVLDHTDFANLSIEGEMALRVGPSGEIAAAFPVIELHNFVFRGERKTLGELVANNGINAGVVLPGDEPAWPAAGPNSIGKILSVAVNGEVIDSGDLWPMEGGAQASLDWLGHHLAEHGMALRPGDLVLAGTPLGLHPVKKGDRISIMLDGQEGVRASVI